MADEKDESTQKPPEDRLYNLKMETSRKMEALQAQLAEQNKRSEAMLQAMIQLQQQKAAAKQDIASSEDEFDVGIDPIDDPKKYAARVAAKAAEKATKKVQEEQARASQVQAEQQAALLNLVGDYPELNDANSELHKQALQLSQSMPEGYRNSSIGLKAAVREAAANLGVLPVSKRTKTNDSDDFSVDSGAAEGRQSKRSTKKDDSEVDSNMLAFAELLGRPVDDPKYIERLKKTAQRKDWKRFK